MNLGRRPLHHNMGRDQATCLDQGSITIGEGRWLNTLHSRKLRRVAGPYVVYLVFHGMDSSSVGFRLGDPLFGQPYPYSLFQPLHPQGARFLCIFSNAIPGNKGVHFTIGDTGGQAIRLSHIHHMAMGPRMPDTNKPCALLSGRVASKPWPANPKAPGPDSAFLHLLTTLKAQPQGTLTGEKYFIVEGLTDDIITVVANTLTNIRGALAQNIGHPKGRKDQAQKKDDTLTPKLMDRQVQTSSPPEQHNK